MREVPITTRIAVLLGPMVQIGSGVSLLTMAFFWIFFPIKDLVALPFYLAGRDVLEGKVTAVEATGASEGDTPVTGVSFQAKTPDGRILTGRSYGTGTTATAGSAVDVEHPRGMPRFCRIPGMRRSTFGGAAGIVVIFPLVGIGLTVAGLTQGRKASALLSSGKLALGTLVSKSATNTQVNNRTVYRLTFQFQDEAGTTHEATARTSLTQKLEDEPEELLFYDPARPSRAYLLDAMPGRVVIDAAGNVAPATLAAFARLLLPLLALLVHGVLVPLRFGL